MLPATYRVLAAIDRAESATASMLAEHLTSDKAQMSRAIAELEALGLIERTPDPADGRIRRIVVSDEGRRRLDAARRSHHGRTEDVLASWPIESIEQLASLVHALTSGETPAPQQTPAPQEPRA